MRQSTASTPALARDRQLSDAEASRASGYNELLVEALVSLPQGTHRGEALRDIVAAAPHLWLSRPASSASGTLMSGDAASAAIALFLGLQVLPEPTQCFCHGTPSSVDVYADHVAGCYNSLSARHNNVRDILAAAARRAVGSSNVWTEVDLDALGRPCKRDNGRRRNHRFKTQVHVTHAQHLPRLQNRVLDFLAVDKGAVRRVQVAHSQFTILQPHLTVAA